MKWFKKFWKVGKKFILPAAGAGVGIFIANCFGIEEVDQTEGEPDEPEVIDADFEEVGETEEV